MWVGRGAVAAVLASALMVPLTPLAHAVSAPAITALSVNNHTIGIADDGVLAWASEFEATSADLGVDFINKATSHRVTVDWDAAAVRAGDLTIPAGTFAQGIYYAESASISDSAGGAHYYSVYEDVPLLDDAWFAVRANPPARPSAPVMSEDTMGGPLAGELAVVCSNSNGNGLPILDYTLTATPVGGGEPVLWTHSGASRCSDVISGLVPGAAYDVTAVARTGVGVSASSNVLRDAALPAPPTAPTNLAATPSADSALLEWEPSNGYGQQILYYHVQWLAGDTLDENVVVAVGSADAAPSLSITDLLDGTSYSFRVRGKSSQGWGEWSAWSARFTTNADALPVPSSVKASWTETGAITVEWVDASAPVDDPATAYEVEVAGAGGMASSGEVSCCSWTTDGPVDVNESYEVRLRAENLAGWSGWSTVYTLFPVRPPSSVQSLVVTGRYGRANVSWQEPLTGTPEGGYGFSVVDLGPFGVTRTSVTDDTSLRVDALTPGVDYLVSVWAIGELGRTGDSQMVRLDGTQTTVRAATTLTIGQPGEVRGRSTTTSNGLGIGGATVVLQRRAVGASTFRSTDITAVTRPLGRFDLSFVPRAGVEYRVALVGQPGLGGSAALLTPAS